MAVTSGGGFAILVTGCQLPSPGLEGLRDVLALNAEFLEDSLQSADCLSYWAVRSGAFSLPHTLCQNFFSDLRAKKRCFFSDLSLSLQRNRYCKS